MGLDYLLRKYIISRLEQNKKQEGHEALNGSPEYTGQSQTFNFEIQGWVVETTPGFNQWF